MDGNIDDYDKKTKKRKKGVEKRLRGMDFLGEGADVIIEGSDRTKRKAEQPWERDLRQGMFARSLDAVSSFHYVIIANNC